jgi:hypothetical protein
MFQTATAFNSWLSTSTRSKRSLTVATLVSSGAPTQDALELRNRVVNHPLRDANGSFRQLEVVEAGRRGCHFGTDRFDLEGDPLGSAWPGRAKGPAEVRVLLLELAHLSARSIEVWAALLGAQSDVLVEEGDHLADGVRSQRRGADEVHDPGLKVICTDLGSTTASQTAVVPPLTGIRACHPAAARAAHQLCEDVPAGIASDW